MLFYEQYNKVEYLGHSILLIKKKKQFLLVIIRFTENSEKTNGDVLSKVNYQTETISLTMIH